MKKKKQKKLPGLETDVSAVPTLPVNLSWPICTTGGAACGIIDIIVWPFSIQPQGGKPIAD